MKKIFTLAVATLLTVVVFAADRPTVTLKSGRNYEIVIDGKSYYSQNGSMVNINNLYAGKHTVRVFEVSRSVFRSSRKLVSTSTFRLNKKDVAILVDPRGNLRITESKFGKDFGRDDDWGRGRDNDYGRGNDRDDNNGRDRGRDNRF